jgi:hypothetical protein
MAHQFLPDGCRRSRVILSFAIKQTAWMSSHCNNVSRNKRLLIESQVRAGLMIMIEVPPRCAF